MKSIPVSIAIPFLTNDVLEIEGGGGRISLKLKKVTIDSCRYSCTMLGAVRKTPTDVFLSGGPELQVQWVVVHTAQNVVWNNHSSIKM